MIARHALSRLALAVALAAPLAWAAGASLAAAQAPRPGAAQPAPAQAVPAPVWPQAGSDLPADPDVRFGVLPNGMRYAIKRNATPPGEASLRLRIGAGSLHEAEDQRGLAHFLEHMILNGTTNVPEGEFVRRLERHGLQFGPDTNASTGFAQTVYKLELPETDAETVDTAMYLLREVVDEATLIPSAIDSERGIVLSEERTRSNPAFRAFVDELGFTMRGQRLPDRLPIGLPEVLRTAPRDRFVAFYNAYYRPERATLIAIGDFDVDAMERKIRDTFATWRGEGAPGRDPALGAVAPRQVEARAYAEAGVTDRVSLAWVRQPDLAADTRGRRAARFVDRIALAVLDRRLERIAAATDDPPYVAASGARSQLADSAEIVQLRAVVRPGRWQRALPVIEQEQRRLVQHGITQAELDRELEVMRTTLTTAASRAATRHSRRLSDGLVASLDENEVFTAPAVSLEIFNRDLPGLTPQAVQQAAARLFAGNGPLIYLTSSTPVANSEAALTAAYRTSLAQTVTPPAVQQAVAWPYTSFGTPGRVADRRVLGDGIDATLVRFENGVRLTVKQTAFADDEIIVIVRAGDGRGNLPANGPSPSWALGPGFVMGGMRRINFEQMREALAARSVGANVLLHDEEMALLGRTRPQDFATQMQLLAAYVSEPGWDPTGWNRLRATSQSRHDGYEATPDGIYGRDAAALLHGGDRRWATPTREEMASSSIAEIRNLLEDALAREPIEVIVIGDVTVDEAIAQTAATFGALPPRIEDPDRIAPVNFPAGTPEPVRLTHKGRADQGLAMIAWPTPGQYANVRESRELSVLAAIFRLRLIAQIREEQGTTYSPAANLVQSDFFENFGFLFGRIEAPPASLPGFLADAAAIARNLTETPVTADELERARRPMIEGLQRTRNSNSGWQFLLPGLHEDPRVAAAIRSHLADYQSVTPASLQATARRYFRPDTAWKLVIVPEAGGN